MTVTSRLVMSLIAIGAAAAPAFSQTWQRQSPWPADTHVQATFFTSETTGWISGPENLLMGTTDGGQTWAQTSSFARAPNNFGEEFVHMQFVDDDHGFILGNGGYRTVNGGDDWVPMANPGIGSVIDFKFTDANDGWAWNRRAVSRTTNAGGTWSELVPYDFANFIMDVDIHSSTLALAVGRVNNVVGVFRSTNGGNTWQQISTLDLDFVLMLNATEVIGANGTRIYRSTNGGVTWSQRLDDFDPDSQADVQAITRIDEDAIGAIALDGRIWISHDRGDTWSRVMEPVGVFGAEWDLHFPSPQVGYAAGPLGIILKTTDAGQTWTQISNGAAAYLNAIVMTPQGTGLAVGEDGVVLRTTDFGQHWMAGKMRDADEFWHIGQLHTIEAIDSDTFLVGGSQGRIFRTDDAGQTWKRLTEFGGNSDVFDLSFLNELEGWAFGTLNSPLGFIDHTTDGGETWTRRILGEPPPLRGQMFNANDGRSLLLGDSQLFTTNGFQSAFFETLPAFAAWIDLEYATPQVGWILNNFGRLLRTVDGGHTLVEQDLPAFNASGGGLSDRCTDLRVLSTQEAWVSTWRPGASDTGRIYHTTDAGSTWAILNPIIGGNEVAGQLIALDVLPSGEIWTASNRGYIFNNAIPQPAACIGDATSDSAVNFDDLNAVLTAWGMTVGTASPLDVAGGDGVVNINDLNTILERWLDECP